MAVYAIVKIGDSVLKERAKPVKSVTPNIIKLLKNMADTMYEYKGAGLAAPQIGISKRVVVIDIGEGLIEMINPEIIEVSEETEVDAEGCLSIPGVRAEVERCKKVTVRFLNSDGEEVEITGEGFLARAFQHEIDHLNGTLFTEKASRILE